MPSDKINKILTIILVACLGIALRAWHLGMVQRDQKWIEAQKPQSRAMLLRADRGIICDRFQIPLAINRIAYHASVYYGQITEIPAVRWQEDASGRRTKIWPRKEYIKKLSAKLGLELNMDAERIEDLIYAKASLFPQAPYIIKTNLTEREHYRIKGLERDWPGLHAEIAAERFYPQGKTACHIVGTMGAINQKKYQEIIGELRSLQESLEQGEMSALPEGCESFDAVYRRLGELKEKAYTLSDLVGKSGIEKQFEEELRGYFGKKNFEIDQKERFVRELPGGRPAVPGRQVVLAISSELQQFAEELLAANEKIRDGKSIGIDPTDKKRKPQKQPWIKGGAIVAMDPNNGELLAMASYPRFDPNDFIPTSHPVNRKLQQKRLVRWLENTQYAEALWNGSDALYRERFSRRFFDEDAMLTWDLYLELILPKEGPLRTLFQTVDTVKGAIQIQEDFEILRYFSNLSDPVKICELSENAIPESTEAKAAFHRLHTALTAIPSAKDRLFAIDLFRLIVDSTRFSDELIEKVGTMKLSAYRDLSIALNQLEMEEKENEFSRFHREVFSAWRQENQKEFLAAARKQEKEKKTYARPYLDYLDKKEQEMFASYWNEHRLPILREHLANQPKLLSIAQELPGDLAIEFLRSFRSFQQLDRPLLGTYKAFPTEKDLARAALPKNGFGSMRSYAFQTSGPQGSLFKLVTAYEGLRQGHSPTLVDWHGKNPKYVAYATNGTPYPRLYKGGRLPRSSSQQVGKIDLIGALEHSSNPYFSILAGDFLSDPEDLKNAARNFGYGERTGLELPGEASGNLPTDLMHNRTSLYSFAIGQHTLLATPIQSAMVLSAIGNGGNLLKSKIVLTSKGFTPNREPLSAFSLEYSLNAQELKTLGIPFSLFTGLHTKNPIPEIATPPTEIRKKIPLPQSIRSQILEGMDRSLWSAQGGARANAIRFLHQNPSLALDYRTLEHQMIGKTSTAQILFSPNANPSGPIQMVKHTWFGAISFPPNEYGKIQFDNPELVVVVFFRFADAGKEAAPIAAQMIKKWREIQKKHE